MLRPDKHTNPKLSIVFVASVIISELNRYEMLTYDELLSSIINKVNQKAKELYLPAMSFLFLLNKIEYLDDLDSLRIIR